jgi:hypothetical protein
MKVPAQPLRCTLARLQPQVTDLDAMKRSGWQEQHILVVNAEDARLDFCERELVQRIGERLYGNRGGPRHG